MILFFHFVSISLPCLGLLSFFFKFCLVHASLHNRISRQQHTKFVETNAQFPRGMLTYFGCLLLMSFNYWLFVTPIFPSPHSSHRFNWMFQLPLHFFLFSSSKSTKQMQKNKQNEKSSGILCLGWLIIHRFLGHSLQFTAKANALLKSHQLGYIQHNRFEYLQSFFFALPSSAANFQYKKYSWLFSWAPLSIGRGKSVWLCGRNDSVHTEKRKMRCVSQLSTNSHVEIVGFSVIRLFSDFLQLYCPILG